jgi:4-hydroxy-tetrahydrodipicolinate synthase
MNIVPSLLHSLIPAPPVPLTVAGMIDDGSQHRYATWLSCQPIGGVAVWAHTGRGLHLTPDQRLRVIATWRDALPGKVLVAGVGGDPVAATDDEFLAGALAMGEMAAHNGADAFLVYAPTRYRTLPTGEMEERVLNYYHKLSAFGVPLIVFYLYEAAGGISYSPELLDALMAMPSVAAIKLATYDSIVTYQNIASHLTLSSPTSRTPPTLLLTGEDRFFGYSLMCGAQGALVGMGSVFCELQHAMMNAFVMERYVGQSFMQLSALVDSLGAALFREPLQGYIQRTLWAMADFGLIAESAAHDPWAPPMEPHARESVNRVVEALR